MEEGPPKATMLARAIQLADEVAKQCAAARCFRSECGDLKLRADELAALLHQAARAWGPDPYGYDRPATWITWWATQALADASALAARCAHGHHPRLRSLFKLSSPAAGDFPRTAAFLDTALQDVAWLLRFSAAHAGADEDGGLRGIPNIALSLGEGKALFLIWDYVARLHTGGLAARADSAASLASLAGDTPQFAKLIVEEDGIRPLLGLLKEGTDEGQEAAARALGLLGRDAESVEKLVQAGICPAFTAVLKAPAPMHVQAAVAEAIAALADRSPACREQFTQNNAVRYLVGLLASGSGGRGARDAEEDDPELKARLQAVAAKSLWMLGGGHLGVCKSGTESRSQLCFAVVLENGDSGVCSLVASRV
ncbi:uncharacterized protein LOC100839836 [Brachypodium distachyon]|uniref:DUF7792 domain-containing protein n=1 Tax=Brachypodium distachyon TaxID=15368 RepID=I1I2Y2_BRADI|nr:uncharacterized protein LOC100839836 [Brachypodium distachyon]KQJ96109.1 hypothetical protein BRADI_3g21050v3 [Brachypodium distachyon]|eukprot:XP_003573728.2 uncharacterized protein LOC100839836 [Brachypodium distachyon]